MASTVDFLYRIAAEQRKAGKLTDSDLEKFFRPKISSAHWQKMYRFKKRIEKELENV